MQSGLADEPRPVGCRKLVGGKKRLSDSGRRLLSRLHRLRRVLVVGIQSIRHRREVYRQESGRAPSFPKAPFISMAISRILSVPKGFGTAMIIYLDPLV